MANTATFCSGREAPWPFPPLELFLFSPGELAPRGGWLNAPLQNPLWVESSGNVSTNGAAGAVGTHDVSQAALNVNGPWDLTVGFTPDAGSGSNVAEFIVSIDESVGGYFCAVSIVFDGSDDSYTGSVNFGGIDQPISGTLSPGDLHTIRVHRTLVGLETRVFVDDIEVSADTLNAYGNTPWQNCQLTLDVSAGGVMVINSLEFV